MDNKISVFKDNSGDKRIKRDKLEEFLKEVKSNLAVEHISGNESASVQKTMTLAIACQKLFNELEEIKSSGAGVSRELVGNALWCLNWMDENTDNQIVKDHLAKPIELITKALNEPSRNCDVYLTRKQAKEAYDRALSKNMQERLSNNDTVSEFPEYEDWLLELYKEEQQ